MILPYEIALLDRMPEAYRSQIWAEQGITDVSAQALRAQLGNYLGPMPARDLGKLVEWIGQPAFSVPEESGNDSRGIFSGSTRHSFVLPLWSHLYWVVRSKPDGALWSPEFQNQAASLETRVDPDAMRPGFWTLNTLRQQFENPQQEDGWDEQAVYRFEAAGSVYEGEFVYGLLMRWRAVESAMAKN